MPWRTLKKVGDTNDQAYLDFNARRLVEMAGDIIMAYLLLVSAKTNESFVNTAKVYTRMIDAEVTRHCEFIDNCAPADLAAYGDRKSVV